jgi:predicted  nucleic acid-binding Zn-ribbon protein
MEWVIVVLAIGCAFFAFQIVMDYVKYKSVLNPRIERLELAKGELQSRIDASRGELAESQEKLGPAKEEIERLEQEYQDLQAEIREERERGGRRESGEDRFADPT